MIQTDACIVGAGPGGAATALKLSYLGIPSVLIDKAQFPRDKICGDAISGKVTTLLKRLDPDILSRFDADPMQVDVWGMTFVAPNHQEIHIPFHPNMVQETQMAPGYVAKRVDFDHFLIQEIQRRDNIQWLEKVEITQYEKQPDGWLLSDDSGQVQVKTRMLIVADGAHSQFSRKIAGLEKDSKHYAGAIRTYYKGVSGLDKRGFIELHFIKSLTPGYFWIFPLPNGLANVGLGMRSDILSKKKFNLRKELEWVINEHPAIKARFQHAERLGPVMGYGLPLGSKRRSISGDHYMLVGDAGHLIDPLTGEGIGNAFYSGFIAAEQVQQCLLKNDFSAAFLKAYDQRVDRVLGSEMRLSYKLQKMLAYPFLVNLLARIIAGNQRISAVISGMYNDFSLREQLAKPLFWVKMWFKR
ncbi:MAG TPA: geranylgeranyl reductase family protein [Saprospiraceae bacterium]|nr:geranylgeranyl reductase family protein [Saprospiraceae bacterium]HMQ82908.1 geranylgeranyl reductase family protein [Saprospiraceae bacterium]